MKVWLPLLIFFGIGIILFFGLFNKNEEVAPQINKSAPTLNLPLLNEPHQFYRSEQLKGKITVVNFWATWCPPCRQEHPVLVEIVNQYHINMIGINYKDQTIDALQWLQDLGNPYSRILVDKTGRAGIDWGVIAVPETFVVDSQGIVRYKHTGPITWQQWETEIWPFINTLS